MQEFTNMLKIGAFTVTKTEGDLQPGETDTIAIECYPEFVGSEDEDIIIFASDSEYENGKLIKLSVNSCMPCIDLQDLDVIFHENHIVDRIEDFTCVKEVCKNFLKARSRIFHIQNKNKIKRLSVIILDRCTYRIRPSRKMPVFS